MTNDKEKLDRRSFIKKASLSAGAAGLAAIAATNTAKAAAPAMTKSSSSAGYQETDHVLTYYKLAAF